MQSSAERGSTNCSVKRRTRWYLSIDGETDGRGSRTATDILFHLPWRGVAVNVLAALPLITFDQPPPFPCLALAGLYKEWPPLKCRPFRISLPDVGLVALWLPVVGVRIHFLATDRAKSPRGGGC